MQSLLSCLLVVIDPARCDISQCALHGRLFRPGTGDMQGFARDGLSAGGVLRHARAAFFVSFVLFALIAWHHSSLPPWSGAAGLEQAREAARRNLVERARSQTGAVMPGNANPGQIASSGQSDKRQFSPVALGNARAGLFANGEPFTERQQQGQPHSTRRKLSPSQRRAQHFAQEQLSQRVCGSPAVNGCGALLGVSALLAWHPTAATDVCIATLSGLSIRKPS